MPTVTLPVTLVALTNENVNDLNANLNAIVAALNGGLDEVNVPNLAAAFTSYKRIQRASGGVTVVAAGTYLLQVGPWVANSLPAGNTSAFARDHIIYLDPAIYAANTRTTKLNLRYVLATNAVAPAITFTAGLYPIATFGGASGSEPFIATLGTVIAGSTVAISTSGLQSGVSGDFNFPAAGAYAVAVVTSGTPAAGAITSHIVNLDMRQV